MAAYTPPTEFLYYFNRYTGKIHYNSMPNSLLTDSNFCIYYSELFNISSKG